MNKTKLGVFVLAALLSACGAAPLRSVPPMHLPEAFAHGEEMSVGDVALPDWWMVFDDPALHELVRRGLAANLDLRQAVERVQRSRALAAGAHADRAPRGGLVLGTRTQRLSPFELPVSTDKGVRLDNATGGADMAWEIDLFGRLRSTALAADARAEADAADAAAMGVAVGAEIAHAWFTLNGTRAALRVTNRVVANRDETLGIVLRRAAAGFAAPLDEARARADLEAARSELPALKAALAVATHRLAVLLGESPSEYIAPPEPASSSAPSTLFLPEPRQWALQRPDLQAAEARLRAMAIDVESVRAEFLPRLSVMGAVGMVAGSMTGFGAAGIASWLLAPSLSLPVFDRARIDARLQAARAEEREALLVYEERVLLATEELETAVVQVREGHLRLSSLQERARQTALAEQLARKRFEAGGTDLLELLDAQRSAQHAEMGLVVGTAAQQQHVVALQRALVARFAPSDVSEPAKQGRPGTAGHLAERS